MFPPSIFGPQIPIAGTMPHKDVSTAMTITKSDRGSLINFTSGTFTVLLASAKQLGKGWYCFLQQSGTGVVTVKPVSLNETFDGSTGTTMYYNELRLVWHNGQNILSAVLRPFYLKALTSMTYVHPTGYQGVLADLTGAGGGGGSGRRGAAGAVRSGGAAGGAAARVVRSLYGLTVNGSTTLTIGAFGPGGAVQTVNTTDGFDGTAGGNTSFGSLIAYGGCAGKGGAATKMTTSGSGSLSAGSSSNASASQLGGGPSSTLLRGSTSSTNGYNWGEGGGGAQNSVDTPCTEYGGAGCSASDVTATTVAAIAGSALFGVSAGTHGGWITAADTLPATACTAGLNGTYTNGGGAVGGTCGAVPTVGGDGAAATTDTACGNSGAGGGSTITAGQTGKAGGAGGLPGGAGGGGGAVLNGQNSGAGGPGANGWAIIKGLLA